MSGLNQKVLSFFHLLPAFTFFFPSFGLIHLNVPLPSYSCLHSATFHHSSSSWTISSLVLRSCHQTRMLDPGQFDSGQSRMAEGAVDADHMQSNDPQGRSASDRMCVMDCEESASGRLRIQGPPARGSSFRRLRPTWTRSRSRSPVVECTQIESSPEPALAQWEGGGSFFVVNVRGRGCKFTHGCGGCSGGGFGSRRFRCDAHTE